MVNDALEPYAVNLINAVLACLQTDNEENALVCLRVMFDVFKIVKSMPMEVRQRGWRVGATLPRTQFDAVWCSK